MATRKKTTTKSTTKKSQNGAARNGGRNLVVVESPAKAKTIGRILGREYQTIASLGHVRDLPEGKLGIEIEKAFRPQYAVLKGKSSVIKELKDLGQNASAVYLATDPDREGEAISWHIVKAAGWDKDSKDLRRVVFHEITEQAIKDALKHPRDLDHDLIDAQQARRILDRLVGYQLSPLLWRKVQRGLSAGRVQSVALRLVVEREREIDAFVPREYWSIEATLAKGDASFVAALHSLKGEKKKIEIPNEAAARDLEKHLQGAAYKVDSVKTEEKHRRPSPPFTTSTLQQEAWRKLRFSAKKTMAVAQQLYEGLPLGDGASVGLITYMRTDSNHLAHSAIEETRGYISQKYGAEYVPPHARVYKTKAKAAQEAHEAIRPTSTLRTPDSLKAHLNREQQRLYDLIWRRMVACQMADSVYDATTVNIDAHAPQQKETYVFRATGTQTKFPGFVILYMEGADDTAEDGGSALPSMTAGDLLRFLGLKTAQHFTEPPPRFTEASLIKLLEEKGIGRPSTYAPILSTLTDRNYVLKEQGRLKPTALGTSVCDLLIQFFPRVMDVGFTAHLEDELDEIARGEMKWVPMLEEFYKPFKETLDAAHEAMPRVKIEEPTDEKCDKCGKPMVIKTGRFGRFMACSGFPECRNTKPILKRTGVACPKCGGDLVERRSRGKGRLFYGCANYPKCDFSVVQRPLPEACPECGGLMVAAGRNRAKCTKCAWQGEPQGQEEQPQEDKVPAGV
ncbi:MAG: type I DNA topoisomerase [SAR202 cluster bacterium]|nr:type I DNA topoisomerase [SAR202 cluster bacterium]